MTNENFTISGLRGEARDEAVKLFFDPLVSFYEVEWAETLGGFVDGHFGSKKVQGGPVLIDDLENGTEYLFRVRALTPRGYGPDSAIVKLTPAPPPPPKQTVKYNSSTTYEWPHDDVSVALLVLVGGEGGQGGQAGFPSGGGGSAAGGPGGAGYDGGNTRVVVGGDTYSAAGGTGGGGGGANGAPGGGGAAGGRETHIVTGLAVGDSFSITVGSGGRGGAGGAGGDVPNPSLDGADGASGGWGSSGWVVIQPLC